jgi:two-component system, OmpR family, sensor histidine kinase KdpD
MKPFLDSRKYRSFFKIAPYFLAIILTGVLTILLYLLRGVINPSILALLYLLPVGVSTAAWGLGPGIAAAFAAFLAFNYFFILPYYTLMVRHTQDLLFLVVFLIIAVVISQLVGRAKQNQARATAREHEAIRLSEFSNLLAGPHSENEIAQIIAHQTLETYLADRVEIYIEGMGNRPSILLRRIGKTLSSQNLNQISLIQAPDLIVALQSARGMLGEIRIWRADPPVTSEDERLLRTFASQGVLAIERARLLEADTRAQVLEESDRLKTSLLSSVSHELRTPLATIKAAISSLRSETVDWDSDARKDLLEAVDEETDHLNQLVENLLNMSRIEAGVLKPKREWNSLEEIIASVVRRFQQPAQRLSHRIEIDLPESLPLIPVDYLQMEQVFTNLISNSMKYSPEGSTIRIQAQVWQEHALLVQVINQGPSVPEEHLERIFDKFNRITAADRVTGTGLGLSICKGIIEAHDGRIWAENIPEGFAFNFSVPLTWKGEQPHLPIETTEISSNGRSL